MESGFRMSNGLVGIIANDFARVSIFTACVLKLEVPDGWKKEMLIGGDWCGARNELCQQVLDDGHSHLWFMDDDHAFPPQMLHKLVAHDKPLVTPICLTRVHPFKPVQYTEKLDGEFQYLPIPLSKADTDGLVEIQAGGCAGMLIRRDVIEAIDQPWFEYADRSEDIIFCEKAKAAGFDLYADLSLRLGHVTTAVVWPAVDGDKWVTGLNVGDLQLTVETADLQVGQWWTWELRFEKDGVSTPSFITLERSPNEPVNWQPDLGHVPNGVMQWWLDKNDGDGSHPVGDPFTYEVKETI
jgi:hypothetical protein